MPPPDDPCEASGSWEAAESTLGTTLPYDYKMFIESYGSGYIGEMPLYVNNAFSTRPSINLRKASLAIAAAYQRLIDGGYNMPYTLFPQPLGLLPWGRTGNGDYLHWRTVGSPDKWFVVVWDCGETEFKSFDQLNFIQFLTELLAGRIDVFPRVFFVPPPRFIVDRPEP
jgi:hypothetical protein